MILYIVPDNTVFLEFWPNWTTQPLLAVNLDRPGLLYNQPTIRESSSKTFMLLVFNQTLRQSNVFTSHTRQFHRIMKFDLWLIWIMTWCSTKQTIGCIWLRKPVRLLRWLVMCTWRECELYLIRSPLPKEKNNTHEKGSWSWRVSHYG